MPLFSACSPAPEKPAVRVLIVPKFEIGDMEGDFPGEAQLFYEEYCPGCEEVEIPQPPQTRYTWVPLTVAP
ncbi:MAG: hypothetical protein IIZ51_05420 [Lachnospiraceae bacterium]|nr:hypothetical protein [Lachnospiraceae bacterium]MBQ1400110.1 hypothetical protein [Lachnospiraceae bacterium]MBQ1515270.1 hypothetical protein [Lachnospiraceae bacterium]MBQ4309438.1 hypothetical protein [Lachnospiraceae bacterium]